MSQWFAAHLVLYVKLKKQPRARLTVWENIVLVKADSEEEALAKAQRRGHEDEGDDDGTFRWGGKDATWVFAGVRKLTACEDSERRPGDGTEVSFTELQLESEEAVQKFVRGQPVSIQIQDRFAVDTAKKRGQSAAHRLG